MQSWAYDFFFQICQSQIHSASGPFSGSPAPVKKLNYLYALIVVCTKKCSCTMN